MLPTDWRVIVPQENDKWPEGSDERYDFWNPKVLSEVAGAWARVLASNPFEDATLDLIETSQTGKPPKEE